jgi:hypothetical protein
MGRMEQHMQVRGHMEAAPADEGVHGVELRPERVLPRADVPGVAQWRGAVSAYGWPVEEALRVMSCESGGQPTATGGANYGLFQINAVHSARVGGNLQALYDPATNIRVAYDIWADQGWAPWACKP